MIRFANVLLVSLGLVSAAVGGSPEPTGPVTRLATGLSFVEGPTAVGPDIYFTDIPAQTIHRLTLSGDLSVFTDESNHANGLWATGDDTLLACEMDGAVVRYEISTGQRTVLTDAYDGTRYNACNDLVVDRAGGIYFTDPQFRAPEPWPQGVRAVYYLPAGGDAVRLTDDLPNPNGIALSPDGRTLYVAPSGSSTMLRADVTGPGQIGPLQSYCELRQAAGQTGGGSDGLTVDSQGNVYFTTALGVQIADPDGEILRVVELPEHPANVTFAGEDRKTLIATARTSVYAVPMSVAGVDAIQIP